jgi:hypothetical protein
MPNTNKYAIPIITDQNGITTTDQQQAYAIIALAVQMAGIRESLERLVDLFENEFSKS